MRLLVLIVLACLACLSGSLRAESGDPGDLFVNAYFAVEAGKKAEAAGNFREANSKFRYAAQILDQISERFPSWQPSIVDYRKKRTSEALAGIQEKIGRQGGAKAPAVAQAVPPVEMPAPDAGGLLPPSDVLPGTPPPARRRTPDRRATETELPTRNPIQELDERMKRLERDLNQARSEAEKAQQEKAEIAKQLEAATEARLAAEKKREALEQRAKDAEAGLLRANSEGRADEEQTKALVLEPAETKKQLRDLKIEADAETEYRQQLSTTGCAPRKRRSRRLPSKRRPQSRRAAMFRRRSLRFRSSSIWRRRKRRISRRN